MKKLLIASVLLGLTFSSYAQNPQQPPVDQNKVVKVEQPLHVWNTNLLILERAKQRILQCRDLRLGEVEDILAKIDSFTMLFIIPELNKSYIEAPDTVSKSKRGK